MAGNTIDQKALIWPERRKFLKRAPLLFAGGLTLAAMPRVAKAFARAGTANVAGTAPSQPAIAKTWGYNTPVFWDDFNDLSSIDVNNTLNPGYKWYVKWFNFGTTSTFTTWPASCFSTSNSILTFAPDNRATGAKTGGAIGSAVFNGHSANPEYTGILIQPTGFYTECRMQAGASPGLANNWFPSYWMWDGGVWDRNSPSFPYGSNRYTELDVIERQGSTSFNEQNYDYSSVGVVGSNNTGVSIANPNAFHTYGMLWVPQSKNSGTGIIQRYYDGVHSVGNDVSYSSSTISPQASGGATTGWMTGLETSLFGQILSLQTGYQWPINVDYVMVWQ